MHHHLHQLIALSLSFFPLFQNARLHVGLFPPVPLPAAFAGARFLLLSARCQVAWNLVLALETIAVEVGAWLRHFSLPYISAS